MRSPTTHRATLRLAAPDGPRAGAGVAARPSVDDLYRQHAAFVARLAFRLLGRDGEVDDVVHDVFVALMRELDRLEDLEDLRGWLTTVATRAVRRRLRRNRLRQWIGLGGDDAASTSALVAHAATPEQQAMVRLVYRALDRLPADQRLAWTLRHVEGETLEAVALRCELSLSTTKRKLAAASDRLSKLLDAKVPR